MSALIRAMLFAVAATAGLPLNAQQAPQRGNSDITVTGTKTGRSHADMSDWRMAETGHVIVFSKGSEKDLVRIAHNLEKLNFLLSVLLDRVDKPDETTKIAVTMIGDAADFEQLRLSNLRWQYGPFPRAFPATVYYDPRDEGPVLATTAGGVKLILQPSLTQPTNRNCDNEGLPTRNWNVPEAATPVPSTSPNAPPAAAPSVDLSQFNIGEISFCQSAEARLYSGFAQNFLMAHFPAAYPRWFVQGFGEMFTTVEAGDGVIEYGRRPIGLPEVMDRYGTYPVADILAGKYLQRGRTWTPYHAWRLVHLLFFSEEWKRPLHDYLRAVASGADTKTAMAAFGDLTVLQKAVTAYRGRKVPYERLTFPPDRAPPPVVRQLTRAEAGLIRGRLELGARIEVPADPRERSKALARRDAWLARLRDNASRFPRLVENQLLLAEAECRSGNAQNCLAAAERALALDPSAGPALVWKGTAMVQLAATAAPADRTSLLEKARAVIAQANHADPESVLPLIAYYDSFASAGEAAPDVAVDGLFKIVDSSPAASHARLQLGEELAKRDLDADARKILLPVANGPFQSPEQPRAAELLKQTVRPGAGR